MDTLSRDDMKKTRATKSGKVNTVTRYEIRRWSGGSSEAIGWKRSLHARSAALAIVRFLTARGVMAYCAALRVTLSD